MKASGNNIEWAHIGRIGQVGFMANDILMYSTGCCLKFLNIHTGDLQHMVGNRHCVNGDGIRAVRGHRSLHVFAYAERCREAIIFVKEYPSLKTIVEFKDGPPEGYTTLAFSDTSLLIALGDIPNFVITIWNWRRQQKLGELTSNIRLERQMLRCSWGTPVSMVQMGKNCDMLYIWDVFICCKTAVLAKHELKFQKDRFKFARFNDCVWTKEGNLYVIDVDGCVYTMTTDLRLKLMIEEKLQGDIPTSVHYYKLGLVVSGPNCEIRSYVKQDSWTCEWRLTLDVGMTRMFGHITTTLLIGILMDERIVKITKKKITNLKLQRNNFNDFCMIYPIGECIAVLRQNKVLDIYNTSDGTEVFSTALSGKAMTLAENPELPYIAIGYNNGILELMSVYNPQHPSMMTSFYLTKNSIENVKFFEQGRLIVAGCSDIGEFFIIEGLPGRQMNVVSCIQTHCQIVDFMLVASKNCYRLFLIPVTANCLAGNKIIRYCIMGKNNINIKEYLIENERFLYHKLIPTKTSTRDRIFYAVPFDSRNIHILETKRGDSTVRIISEIKTGHQMRNIGLRITKHHAVTWGYDGFIIARDNNFEKNVGMALPHHRYDGGVKKAYVDPFGKYIISLGRENNLMCTNIVANKIDEDRKNALIEWTQSVKFTLMFKRPTLGFKPEGQFANKTWLEVEEILQKEKERNICKIERNHILQEFVNIKSELTHLVTKNLEGPENQMLDLKEFYLDTSLYHHKRDENRAECRHTEIYLKALIVAQDKITQYVMENYWGKMKSMSQSLFGIYVHTVVARYGFLPDNVEKIKRLAWVEEQRKLETFLSKKASFLPWYIQSKEELLELTRRPKLPRENYNDIRVLLLMDKLDDSVAVACTQDQQAVYGTVTSQFIEQNPAHYYQKEICTFYQCDMQQLIAEFEVFRVKVIFNQFFEELVAQKYRDVAYIADRNIRLRHIISEINYFSTNKIYLEIHDPKWTQTEQTNLLKVVLDEEMTVTPYISPSEQLILDAKAAEEERIRLALLADDFKERALMAMMNGVLEVRWEDELKKDVPIPKCMIEKEPEQFNEEDLRTVRDYEDKVAQLHSERERYKNLLDNEFTKIRTHLRDVVRKFNQKLKECLEFKMNIDSAANQENLKVNRVRWKENTRVNLMIKEEDLHQDFKNTQGVIEELNFTISSLTEVLGDCQVDLDVHMTKEKMLDRTFKKEIQEMSPVVQEQATKLYKRRPKTSFLNTMSSAIYSALAKCVAENERSLLLTDDCLEFVKALDLMDQFVGMPPTIDEHTHEIICRHRRLRIEFELRTKAFQVQVGDGEATIATYQKRLTTNKEKHVKLQAKLQQIRADYQNLMHNIEIQLVLRRGLVEVPLTGSLTDFDDACLIPRKEIEYINQLIKEAGSQKIRAMMRNMAFRRNILVKEWEHKKLRMQINDLIEHLSDIENVKFTREMQEYLRAKASGRKFSSDSAESEMEKMSYEFESRLKKKREKLAKVKKQIQSYQQHSDALDKAIKNINIDVCDLQLQKDDELKQKEGEVLRSRMDALLRRSNLVQQIQNNYNEILILQTELELLRLKTYPTFKYKLITNK